MCSCGSRSATMEEPVGLESPSISQHLMSKRIDKELKESYRVMSREVKILLLGPGDSGKTTCLKQMKLLYLDGFNASEIQYYRKQIFDNILLGMRECLYVMEDYNLELHQPENEANADLVFGDLDLLDDDQPYPEALLLPLKALFADGAVQRIMKTSESPLPENLAYFATHLDRLFDPAYRPTNDDILRARGKTAGITETVFSSRDWVYRVMDVGGQRSERKKWIHCFEAVSAVLFLVALSGYDQCLLEDPESNVMREALMLFDSICNSHFFIQSSMILFLNKVIILRNFYQIIANDVNKADVFNRKLLISDVKIHFEDFTGSSTDHAAVRHFFRSKFERLNRSDGEIYVHYTCAVDTKAFEIVMASVRDHILGRNLRSLTL